jgi:hypothetical protein
MVPAEVASGGLYTGYKGVGRGADMVGSRNVITHIQAATGTRTPTLPSFGRYSESGLEKLA